MSGRVLLAPVVLEGGRYLVEKLASLGQLNVFCQ